MSRSSPQKPCSTGSDRRSAAERSTHIPVMVVGDAMTRRRLPIGIQTFRRVREERCYYVDKTAYIRRLLDEGTHHFLSHPRRFGKSLFLDTCKELFEGSEALFRGLAIHDRWDWSVRHPASVRQPRIHRALVRDGYARVSLRHAVRAPRGRPVAGRHGKQRRTAVDLRCG